MDIEDLLPELLWNGKQVQPARKTDKIGIEGPDCSPDTIGIADALQTVRFSLVTGHNSYRQTCSLGPLESKNVGFTGDDTRDLSLEFSQGNAVYQVLKSRSASGNESYQADWCCHVFKSHNEFGQNRRGWQAGGFVCGRSCFMLKGCP